LFDERMFNGVWRGAHHGGSQAHWALVCEQVLTGEPFRGVLTQPHRALEIYEPQREEWIGILAACNRRANGTLESEQADETEVQQPNHILWHVKMWTDDHQPSEPVDKWLRCNRSTNSHLARKIADEDPAQQVEELEKHLARSLAQWPNLLPQLLEKLSRFRWDIPFVPPQRPPHRDNVTFTTQENMYEEHRFAIKPPLEPSIKRLIRGALPNMGCRPPPTEPDTDHGAQ